jgi:hypothetical protein
MYPLEDIIGVTQLGRACKVEVLTADFCKERLDIVIFKWKPAAEHDV